MAKIYLGAQIPFLHLKGHHMLRDFKALFPQHFVLVQEACFPKY